MKSQNPAEEVVEHCFGMALMDYKIKSTLVHSTGPIQNCPKLVCKYYYSNMYLCGFPPKPPFPGIHREDRRHLGSFQNFSNRLKDVALVFLRLYGQTNFFKYISTHHKSFFMTLFTIYVIQRRISLLSMNFPHIIHVV